jgi:hypothetical protein
MKNTSTRLALCLLAFGLSGISATAEPLTTGCPAPRGSSLAEFEACAPLSLKLPAPVAEQAEVAAPVKVAPPVVVKAPELAVVPVRAVVPAVRVATAQRTARKVKRLTMIPWLVGAYQ